MSVQSINVPSLIDSLTSTGLGASAVPPKKKTADAPKKEEPKKETPKPEAKKAKKKAAPVGEKPVEEKKNPEGPSGFQVNAITLDSHFADDSLRQLIYGGGFSQQISSKFSIAAGLQFNINNIGFFAKFYSNHGVGYLSEVDDPTSGDSSWDKDVMRPEIDDPSYTAEHRQMGVQFGMEEESSSVTAENIKGTKWHVGLFRRSRAGIGIGSEWCDKITKPEGGAKCSDSKLQISAFSESDHAGFGYGPLEMGLRLYPAVSYLNSDPRSNRLPLVLSLRFNLNPPSIVNSGETPQAILDDNKTVTNPQVAKSMIDTVVRAVELNKSSLDEYSYELTRTKSLEKPALLSTLNLGTMAGGVFNGIPEGSLAYRLGGQFKYGNTGQRIALGVPLAAEALINLIGWAGTPAIPNSEKGDWKKAIEDTQGRAYGFNLPQLAARDAIIGLYATGAMGDLNQAIIGDKLFNHYTASHGIAALLGLVLTLSSGDGSNVGFFAQSTASNNPPTGQEMSKIYEDGVLGSRFDLDSQYRQAVQLNLGMMLLSLGINGLMEFGIDKYKYDSRDLKQRKEKE